MHINVISIDPKSSFIPKTLAIFFRDNGSMKDDVFNLTLSEVRELIEQLNFKVKEIL